MLTRKGHNIKEEIIRVSPCHDKTIANFPVIEKPNSIKGLRNLPPENMVWPCVK